ncbi:hypothetical protein G7Y89_g7714 [Cudoniella acicularis]|uniref:Uncharacterized protein n=1 Tax=Cudoniella acicularis TaxID=354080 RepID=A0A8H4RKQ2_9HELO|nr:hypothetical protein G7Y89_g7714 [Cudoniella acicularis]
MAPPRIQCVNSLRTVSRQAPGLRAAFSTSQIIRAEDDSEPPKRSSPNDFLSSLSSPVQPASIPRAPRFERSSLSSPSPSPIPRNNSTGAGRAAAIIDRSFADRKRAARENPSSSPPGSPAPGGYGSVTAADLEQHKKTVGLGRQLTRKFKAGDVYAPHDLSSIEMEKYRKRQRPHLDCFDVLGLNPLDHYRVSSTSPDAIKFKLTLKRISQ